MSAARLRIRFGVALFAGVALALAVLEGAMGFSFLYLSPGFAQHIFGTASSFNAPKGQKGYLGGVVVLQDGTVLAAECNTSSTRFHRYDAVQTTVKSGSPPTTLHKETILGTVAGGCGIAYRPSGPRDYVYANMNDGTNGLSIIDLSNLSSTKTGQPGNALGVAVDPVTSDVVYAGASCKPGLESSSPLTCKIFDFNPATGAITTFASLPTDQVAYVDGLAFDPTGAYLFLTNRSPYHELVVVSRAGAIVRRVSTGSTEPIGIGFHAASPKFVVTNNYDKSMTRFDFPNDDFAAAPTMTTFADDGFRGDLMQAGPDGCLYVTQDGARYDDGSDDSEKNSIVQICGGFAPPPGITPNPPAPSSLCGYVYNDADNDGVRESGEAGIGGVTINLSGTDLFDLPVSASKTTASDGTYCFNALSSGKYTITEVQPSAYLDGKDTQGSPGTGTLRPDSFADITLDPGFNGSNNNFGELLPSSLGGFVYVDADNNGVKGSGEAAVPGAVVTLTGTDDRGASVNMPGATGTDGAYLFTNLRPGTYTIAETQPAGYLDGKDTQGTPGTGTVNNDAFSGIALDQNVNGRDNNFGELLAQPALTLVKKTNGFDNPTAPGRLIPVGAVVTWTYLVTNTGNETLSTIAVTDDKVAAVACPATTLDPGANITCSATGAAVAGQYTNIGTVRAVDALGTAVTATDTDNYFGAAPAIAIVTKTNGTDNNVPPGPTIVAGSTVTWTYVLTNTGNVALSNVAVIDNKLGAIACPSTNLAASATMTCTKSGTATAGAYTNIGTVTAKDGTGAIVTATDPDNYFGAAAGVQIVKRTNGTNNDTGTGPVVPMGAPVTWTYDVTNTGNVALTNIAVTDDKLGAVACPAATLDVGAGFTCTMSGTAVAGQYVNVGTVTATAAGATVTATNRDAYFGASPAVSIVKTTNGVDGDTASLVVAAGSPVTWTYAVTNRGNIALSAVAVVDDKAGAVTCPATTIAAGATMTCTKTGIAVAGQYANVGSVTASDPTGAVVTASNADGYFGSSPSISIVTQTNGTNNDAPPGPSIAAGAAVNWNYIVTNGGNIMLSNILVSDNKAGTPSCPSTTLAAGASMTCTKAGTALPGQYTNIGTVTAKDPLGKVVTASNPDNYFGVNAVLSIVTKTNGTDNDTGSGPAILVGAAVTWTYTVANAGNATLSQVAVTDDRVGAAACPATVLAPGASMICTKTGIAILGPYTNIGTATAVDTLGRTISAQNVDRYFGVEAPASDLAISMTGPTSGTAGTGGLVYRMVVINNGPSLVNAPIVSVPLPAGMSMTSVAAPPAGWTCSAPASSTFTCSKASMAIGEVAALSFTAALSCPFPNPAPASVAIVATATSSTEDPMLSNNSASIALSVVNPPPTISNASADPNTLWPPNHKMAGVQVNYTLIAACGGTPTATLAVTSNEGDSSDWQILDTHRLNLSSERLGTGKEGRIYTITITATDPTGASSQKTVLVTVPHDQGKDK